MAWQTKIGDNRFREVDPLKYLGIILTLHGLRVFEINEDNGAKRAILANKQF